jgi:hypothetical protein
MADRVTKLRAMERVFQAMQGSISVLEQVKLDIKDLVKEIPFNDGVLAAGSAIQDAVRKLAEAQVKLTYSIQNEVDDMYTAHCGHRFKNGVFPTCGCGPAAF